ncbi:hypothetical protein SAMN02982929_02046 [Saccharopolyspora kobensis]|uniref:Secreted protein n=1 Tax=Saccharopolyspora kobensis TaxID=146035 RepID=A0A1H5ZZK1_9PSEU|nr:hypothetical protein [Saccharopolyspora kobensis]SEG41127.1 hypothetical protein SAMN02982929_02046 [Saccharopolyspora kobensis]SFE15948.1 hypothetical protein SAMN05216506_109107 [Saccharopolyspora kobensis]
MNETTHTDHHAHRGHAAGHHGHAGHHGDGGAPEGLQISKDGYTFAPETARLDAGGTADYRFRILGPDGAAVTSLAEVHGKRIHLIAVRRDLTGFWHLHPVESGDGTWTVPLELAEAGQYRVFIDFQPDGAAGLTLGADLAVAGDFQPRPVPDVAAVSEVDGYEVVLDGELQAGQAHRLALTVHRDGVPVTDLEPYLGAYGHLVALRLGDLAYLHVHPEEATGPGPEIGFHAAVPGPGTYRLFLDFKHAGKVRTAQFTVVA